METSTRPHTEPRQHPAAGPTPPPSPGYYYPRPSLIGGIMRSLVRHTLFSLLTSAIGFNLLGIPLAIILWVMGWRVGLPGHVKENVQGFFHRITGAVSGEKEAVMEETRGQREATEETPRPQEQRLAGRFSRGEPQAEPNDSGRNATLPDLRELANRSANPNNSILRSMPGGSRPPGTAAADRRAPPSPQESPARPADAPAGGDYLRGLGLKAFAESLTDTDKENIP